MIQREGWGWGWGWGVRWRRRVRLVGEEIYEEVGELILVGVETMIDGEKGNKGRREKERRGERGRKPRSIHLYRKRR